MEICGSHTAVIARSGIRAFLPEGIRMIAGPGCPVCVTVTSYLDRLIELSFEKDKVICSFGDLIRVPGSSLSLEEARSKGGDIRMLYSPLDMVSLAKKEKGKTFIFAAVGFETTAPVYAELLTLALEEDLHNIKLLTSLKTMPKVVERLEGRTEGFILPGHVCTVTGYEPYIPLAEKLGVPMVAAGFTERDVLRAVYALVKLRGKGEVKNLYPAAVTEKGNEEAKKAVDRFFTPGDASWRGMGSIEGSGLYLKKEYEGEFDAGSFDLSSDSAEEGCRCSFVITGEEKSSDCPLFGRGCTPSNPKGACMVSREGACFNEFVSRGRSR